MLLFQKWCKEFLEVNPEQSSWRENAGLLDEEKNFGNPLELNPMKT